MAESQEWGLFHNVDLTFWIACLLSIIILDFAIYLQHVASHKIPILWRLHKVHHSDRDIDVTTAIRFHPVEIGLSMLYKVLVIFLIAHLFLRCFYLRLFLMRVRCSIMQILICRHGWTGF